MSYVGLFSWKVLSLWNLLTSLRQLLQHFAWNKRSAKLWPIMEGLAKPFKSLATWKTWWSDGSISLELSAALVKHLDTTHMKGGQLVTLENPRKISEKDLHVKVNTQVAEAMIEVYPPHKDPSGYLLGDSVLRLDEAIGFMICGKPQLNPLLEEERRKKALAEGGKMRLMLSYIRAKAGRTEKGRTPEVSYLKELWLEKLAQSEPKRSRTSSPTTSSTKSDVTGTTLILGETPGFLIWTIRERWTKLIIQPKNTTASCKTFGLFQYVQS